MLNRATRAHRCERIHRGGVKSLIGVLGLLFMQEIPEDSGLDAQMIVREEKGRRWPHDLGWPVAPVPASAGCEGEGARAGPAL